MNNITKTGDIFDKISGLIEQAKQRVAVAIFSRDGIALLEHWQDNQGRDNKI